MAPTSTPRVGSSKITMSGSCTSDLAITTFCWLPPDSSITFTSLPMARTLSSRLQCSPTERAFTPDTSPRAPASLPCSPM